MNGLIAFTRKEIVEYTRNYKALILILVLMLFGFISPISAKVLPEIIASMDMDGMTITLQPMTYLDAFAQFFKNMTQMGIVVMLLVFSGTLSQEINNGSLILMLAKGLRRSNVILAKFLVAATLWTMGLVLSFLCHYLYTVYLFDAFTADGLFMSILTLWVFGVFVISLLLLTSTLSRGNYGALLLTATLIILLMFLAMLPATEAYNPITLVSINMQILTDSTLDSAVIPAISTTLVLSGLSLALAIGIFQRKQL